MVKKFDPITYDMRVRSVTKLEREKEDTDTTVYKLMARDKDGVNEVVITSARPFKGISAKDGVIQVEIKNSQTDLSQFEMPSEKPKKEKED
jgi:hypothetical protein